MGDARRKKYMEDIDKRFSQLGIDPSTVKRNPTREDAMEALAELKGPIIAAGITDEHDISVALALLLSAVIGFEPERIPPLQFKEPGAARKKNIVERMAQILVNGQMHAANDEQNILADAVNKAAKKPIVKDLLDEFDRKILTAANLTRDLLRSEGVAPNVANTMMMNEMCRMMTSAAKQLDAKVDDMLACIRFQWGE